MAACGLITCQNGMQAGTLQGLVRVRQLMLPCWLDHHLHHKHQLCFGHEVTHVNDGKARH